MNAITSEEKHFLNELVLNTHIAEGPEFAPEHTEALGPVNLTIVRNKHTQEFFLNVFFKDEAKTRTYSGPREMNPTSILTAAWLHQNRYLPAVHHIARQDANFVTSKFLTLEGLHEVAMTMSSHITLADNWENAFYVLARHRDWTLDALTARGDKLTAEQIDLGNKIEGILCDMHTAMSHRQGQASLNSEQKHYLDVTLKSVGQHAVAYIEKVDCFGADVLELSKVMEEAGRKHLATIQRGRNL